MTSLLKASDFIRIETGDLRADGGRRIVDIAPEAVTIRRRVAGVSMAIRLESRAYLGVALRIAALSDGRFLYEVRLKHRDADLSVALAKGQDLAAMEAQWRAWIAFLGLPALAGRTEATDAPVNVDSAELTMRIPHARRRGDALRARRPRFLKRRAFGRLCAAGLEYVDPTVALHGRKADL